MSGRYVEQRLYGDQGLKQGLDGDIEAKPKRLERASVETTSRRDRIDDAIRSND